MTGSVMSGPSESPGELILQKLNDGENALLGFAAGAIEAVMTQPLTFCKNSAQQGIPITMHPAVIFRGTTASMINDGTLTAMQFMMVGWFQKAFTGEKLRELSMAESMVSAFAGGLVSGVLKHHYVHNFLQ